MKQILVYGDSLSWGIVPGTRQRLSFDRRWPGILEAELGRAGQAVRVFESCLNGRRTTTEDPVKAGRNGLQGVAQIVEACSPLDLIIVMLGTNDFQVAPAFNAAGAANGIAELVRAMRSAPLEPGMAMPPIMVVAPPPVREPQGTMAEKFFGAQARCDGLSQAYKAMCAQTGCTFFDAASVIEVSTVDGVHIDADQHLRLGRAIAALMRP